MSYSFLVVRRSFTLVSLSAIVFSLGCGGSSTGGGAATGGGNAAPSAADVKEVKTVDVSKLPALGEKLAPVAVDGFEVEIGDPGWSRQPRKKDFISAFTKEKNGEMPYLIVKQLPASLVPDFPEVTPENVGEFAAALEKQLKASVKKDVDREFPEMPIGLIFGNSAWARYVKGIKTRRDNGESQVLCTVRGGKMFTVELQVVGSLADAGNPKAHRDLAYALAAGAVFTKSGGTAAQSEEKSAEPKSDDSEKK